MSGKTFYIETEGQVGHFINIFESYATPDVHWKNFFHYEEPISKGEPMKAFNYFKYVVLHHPLKGRKVVVIVQFKARKTACGVKKWFTTHFGVFKINRVQKVVRPLVQPHLLIHKQKNEDRTVTREGEWGQFSFTGGNRSISIECGKFELREGKFFCIKIFKG